MQLAPKELDKLVISQLGFIAQRRLARGVKLNHSEATVSELSCNGNELSFLFLIFFCYVMTD